MGYTETPPPEELCSYKIVLYEPVAPYFTNTYNTLISVVQGVTMGFLLNMLSNNFEINGAFDPVLFTKFLVTFLMGCLLWHRYIVHSQYLAWRLGIIDTIIPMVFALIQVLLITVIPREEAIFFFSFITLFFFWGAIAYLNAMNNHAKLNKALYYEHFRCMGHACSDKAHKCSDNLLSDAFACHTCSDKVRKFSNNLSDEIMKFEKKAGITMFICFALFGICSFIIYQYRLSRNYTSTLILTFLCLVVLILLFSFDLRRHLNKAKILAEYRKSYGIQW